jgi:5-methylcytosine-specific restriction endonuclease McrA
VPAARGGRPSARSKPEAKPPRKPAKTLRPRRGRGGKQPDWSRAVESRRTSQPTHREAYAETRRWLLAEHGPVCAYCERTFKASVMTLDHVAPRRGQSAYDRRDNLVLACPECNAAKRDMAPIAFLLARRSRAVSLLRYGGHLSPMLIDLARSLVPASSLTTLAPSMEDDDDGESPYAD